MGYQLSKTQAGQMFQKWTKQYEIFAPKLMEGEGCFSDTDIVRYGKVNSLDEIEWERKSDYSFKEVLLAINETLFYFTEDQWTVPKGPEKDVLIFLRSCDLHAVKRLDEIYLKNGFEDFYYGRVRERAKFILMGCKETCGSGFCVSMGTNRSDNYDAYLKVEGEAVFADFRCAELEETVKSEEPGGLGEDMAEKLPVKQAEVHPDYVTENKEKVTLPKHLSNESFSKEIWKEYGARCIGCGRCNFVCPTCTCFTMQDIFYKDNPKAGERRRVWASCQVDGYTDMAGGHGFRQGQGDRMRFKVMHKIYDYEKRFGYPMCVGCGRCDDVCPEYISYSNCVNRLAKEEMEA
ncbi:anaerobic sulfite reductase subunit AsrA [Lacrimispora sp. 210928-DFI.3.58]|uniref:anaerobic sulfite reductase subunit AsrA n=1 Tax=Lacrimispora sp. 210928-DFI.3.58 TaxID=2883214 RepID=UPI001D074808|nr:anaerobic sulfite reductase subunit AsrA [Lacrimispora sp. 210928-DFI.3.58]MCB7317741.1 anaerobic sulfite reductase subunit AsrA [Lacrimispora sp. 210928-DFI.3.58]